MKKYIILIVFIILALFPGKTYSQVIPNTIYAVTQENLNCKNIKNNQTLSFISFASYDIEKENLSINKGDKIYIKILEYVKPTRGKRNGYYKIQLTEIEGKEKFPDGKFIGKMRVSNPKDIKSIAKSAGVTVAGHILKVPGFSQAIAVSKGLLKPNEDMGRFESAGKNLYESTPLTYIEKGEDFNVEKDGIVVFKLKITDYDEN